MGDTGKPRKPDAVLDNTNNCMLVSLFMRFLNLADAGGESGGTGEGRRFMVEPVGTRALIELAREELGAFAAQVFDLWPAPHHELWAALLADATHARLLIIAPPGHAKSTWCTLIYPAWLIGRRPSVNILLVSATAAQAHLFSATIRETVAANPAYQEVFPAVQLDGKRGRALGAWFVARPAGANKDATVAACGVHGPIIGRRADVILVDDPCTQENTASAAQRDKLWRWFRQTLLTRLRPGGRIIVIMTRWHPDDLAGRLINAGDFTVCHLRALSDGAEVFADLTPPGEEEEDGAC